MQRYLMAEIKQIIFEYFKVKMYRFLSTKK